MKQKLRPALSLYSDYKLTRSRTPFKLFFRKKMFHRGYKKVEEGMLTTQRDACSTIKCTKTTAIRYSAKQTRSDRIKAQFEVYHPPELPPLIYNYLAYPTQPTTPY